MIEGLRARKFPERRQIVWIDSHLIDADFETRADAVVRERTVGRHLRRRGGEVPDFVDETEEPHGHVRLVYRRQLQVRQRVVRQDVTVSPTSDCASASTARSTSA